MFFLSQCLLGQNMRDSLVWTGRAIISPDPDYRPISPQILFFGPSVVRDPKLSSCMLAGPWYGGTHSGRLRAENGVLGAQTCPPTSALQVLVPHKDPQLTQSAQSEKTQVQISIFERKKIHNFKKEMKYFQNLVLFFING